LINDLLKKYILGKTMINIHIIKSQNRNLLYIYILLIMNQNNKIKDIKNINDIIYTEIFDRNIDSNLYDIIINIIIHDSCDLI